MKFYCNICERDIELPDGYPKEEHEKNTWHINRVEFNKLSKEDQNAEIVRQLKLWIKEINDDKVMSMTDEAGWVINTVDEILYGEYDNWKQNRVINK